MKTLILSFLIFISSPHSYSNALEFSLTEEDTLKYNFNKYRQQAEPLILHAGLEGPNAVVGGLGVVIRDLSHQMRGKSLNCFTLIPYYNFLKGNTLQINSFVSLGFFRHLLFNSLKTTEVFLNTADKQILFSPDPSIEEGCGTVTDAREIYEQTQNFLRLVYFNSALSKFGDIVNADIMQLHAWQTALAAALIKKIYNPLRTSPLLKDVKIISTFHMLSEEQGDDFGIVYKAVGLETPANNRVNLAATALLESDYITTVSQGLITYFNNPATSYGLDTLFKAKEGYMRGITNGINYADFNPFLEENLGQFHLPINFTNENLRAAKTNSKIFLKTNNLIPCSTKPLMLYVGRYSNEKGMEFFETIIEKWLSLGGQMVLMGVYNQDQKSINIINSLMSRQKTEDLFSNNLRIYTDFRNNQLEFIPGTTIQKGKLIRFAADYTCIPSKVESCGLVSMESLSLGTLIFTSWVQGLKDSCFPYGVYHPLLNKVIDENDFNAVSFQYSPSNQHRTIQDINRALDLAHGILTGKVIDEEGYLSAQKRIIQKGNSFDWGAEQGPLDQYQKLYSDLTGEDLQPSYEVNLPKNLDDYDDNKDHLVKKLIEKFGCYPAKKRLFSYDKYYPFVLTTLKIGKRESETSYNLPNLKELRKVTIQDKKLYLKNKSDLTIFDTDTFKEEDKSFYVTWILNKKGELFAGAFCHAYFLKSKPGRAEYGYGKPIACGGDIIVKEGKITYIDNRSGHYQPSKDQFLLALHYLYSLGLIDGNTEIKEEYSGKEISLEDIKTLDVSGILSYYPDLNNLLCA